MTGNSDKWGGYEVVRCRQSGWVLCFDGLTSNDLLKGPKSPSQRQETNYLLTVPTSNITSLTSGDSYFRELYKIKSYEDVYIYIKYLKLSKFNRNETLRWGDLLAQL